MSQFCGSKRANQREIQRNTKKYVDIAPTCTFRNAFNTPNHTISIMIIIIKTKTRSKSHNINITRSKSCSNTLDTKANKRISKVYQYIVALY